MKTQYPTGPASLFSTLARAESYAPPAVLERHCPRCGGLTCFRYVTTVNGARVYVDGCRHQLRVR